MSIRVLIVDDHSIFIDGIQALLKDEKNMEVIGEASNGNQALTNSVLLKPDVILMDIQMPGMDGIAATKAILEKLPDVKVIALTMLDEGASIRKMLEAGVSGYVLKTVSRAELVNAINKVAAGEKYLPREVSARLDNELTSRTIVSSPVDTLSKREREILKLIARGLTDKEIAEQVHLSPLTVISHRKNMLGKLGLKNKVELTRFAIDNGLVD
ncbi:MAG TPA: response regulator transcription factor [Bacteroidia bacterium]|jgi:DNA-binding NarL/FixJ family response regulator